MTECNATYYIAKHYLPTLGIFASNSLHDSEHFNCLGCYEPSDNEGN